jgi:septal ring factor EnvC (AmiA/AmiB activator)
VAFADRYGAFGHLVILDHGDHYYTVMGDLGAIDVRVGDDVSAGARVGSVGVAPARDGAIDGERAGDPARPAGLYFEVRHGATAVDPSLWLGL